MIDKVTGKSVVRRVPFEPGSERASKTLAIRAIELLRSSFLEIDLAAHDRRNEPGTAPPPPAVVHFVEMEKLALHPERFGIEVGGAAVVSLDGVGPAMLPLVRFDWSLRPWSLLQAALAGLGTRPTVANAEGSAQVAQAYGLVGGSVRFRAGRRLRPFAALAAGALRTSVEGRADTPNQGRAVEQWSFLVDAGVGSQLRLPDRFTCRSPPRAAGGAVSRRAHRRDRGRDVGAAQPAADPHHRSVAVTAIARRMARARAAALAAGACSRADLDAVTRAPAGDGGPDSATPVTCPSPALQPGDSMQTVRVGGVSRNYRLHVPAAYAGSKPVPLVVDFHGLVVVGDDAAETPTYPEEIDPEGVVMAFPTGSPVPRARPGTLVRAASPTWTTSPSPGRW